MIGVLVLAVALPGLHLAQQTQRADYYVQDGLKVDVKKCEKSLAKFEKVFGVQVPRFQYVRVRGLAEVAELGDLSGPYRASGVVVQAGDSEKIFRVVSTQACSQHEIVHLVTLQIGRVSGIIEEGTASKLGGDLSWLEDWLDHQEAKTYARDLGLSYDQIDARIQTEAVPPEKQNPWYWLADSWVDHLIKEYGMGALIRYYQAEQDTGDVHQAFQRVYGVDLDTSFNAWLHTGIGITTNVFPEGSSRK